MNWKTALHESLIAAQSRMIAHIRTIRTLESLIDHDPGRADLYRDCLTKLGESYDL